MYLKKALESTQEVFPPGGGRIYVLMGWLWQPGFSTGGMQAWFAKEPAQCQGCLGESGLPTGVLHPSPGRKVSGGHRFIMSESVEQKTWKTLGGATLSGFRI